MAVDLNAFNENFYNRYDPTSIRYLPPLDGPDEVGGYGIPGMDETQPIEPLTEPKQGEQ